MSLRQALRAAGASARDAEVQAPLANAAMLAGGITTQRRAEYFVAQLMHECGGFIYREELASGNAYDISVNPRLARDLGNVHPGDGKRFKGRGWIQITGRANYRAAGRALGIDLEAHPERAKESAIAWRIAVWYWTTRGLNALADRGDFVGVTRRINGGTNGLADRQRRLRALKGIDARPVAKVDPYDLLQQGEREHIDDLRARRRTKARHGGKWSKVPYHHAAAERDRVWLGKRLKVIEKGSQAHRPERRAYIRRVLAER